MANRYWAPGYRVVSQHARGPYSIVTFHNPKARGRSNLAWVVAVYKGDELIEAAESRHRGMVTRVTRYSVPTKGQRAPGGFPYRTR